ICLSAKAQKLTQILKELEKNTSIDGSAIVTLKGQMMASALHSDIDERAVAAMAAALTSVGNRVGGTLKIGTLGQMTVAGSDRIILLNSMKEAFLIALSPSDAKIGLLDFEIGQALDKIQKTLG
ncbi:MAG: roadblock/LC7 domain-containing protein, partial [Candidatus Helarchaeota archaeon]